MKLQEALRTGTTLADLKDRYAIDAKRHPEFPNLVLLKYNQLESPFAEPIVREARGVILDEGDNWAVISRAYDKFFNYGEGHAAAIDWSTAKVQEKVDGSLMVLYYYADNWRVASSGTPDAGGSVNGMPFTFAELFWRTWREMGLRLPRSEDEELAFAFELTSPFNRVVVQHSKASLTLIGVRHRSGWEMDPWNYLVAGHKKGEAPRSVYPVVRSFPLQTIDDILVTLRTMEPTQQEGYVVVDGNFNRVKIKNPAYVALHHLKDSMSPRHMVEILIRNESEEFLSYFPEWKESYMLLKNRLNKLISELEDAYDKIKLLLNQKDFALEAVKTRHPGSLFQLRKGQVPNIRSALAQVHVDRLVDLLGAKEILDIGGGSGQ